MYILKKSKLIANRMNSDQNDLTRIRYISWHNLNVAKSTCQHRLFIYTRKLHFFVVDFNRYQLVTSRVENSFYQNSITFKIEILFNVLVYFNTWYIDW